MVAFIPFRGSVIRPEFVRRVPAPAFDSMSRAERRIYLETHPESYSLVTRSPGDGGPQDDEDYAGLIELGKEALERIVASGAFEQREQPAFFLYRLTSNDHVQLGVVGLVETEAYIDGRVKRHEKVRSARAEHLSNHFEKLGVQSSPIALGYRSDPAIRARLDDILARTEPTLSFTSGDGLEQAVWVVTDVDDCAGLTEGFAPHDLYIMDGHHRAAAAARLAERTESVVTGQMLCVLFADDRVNIDPFHRRVLVGADTDFDELRASLDDVLNLEVNPTLATELPAAGHVGVCIQGEWFSGTLPEPATDSPLDAIDPVRLQRQVIGPVLGIDPEHAAGRLKYFLDDADRVALAQSAVDVEVLFVLGPVTPVEVFDVADAGLDMPPKSTYVTPKPRSGVFLRRF